MFKNKNEHKGVKKYILFKNKNERGAVCQKKK